MGARTDRNRRGWRAAGSLALLLVQVGAAVFFILDGIDEAVTDQGEPGFALSVTEVLVAVALLLGIVLSAVNVRRIIARGHERDAALAMARGAFADLVESRFRAWRLSPTEAEVALMSLKGYSIAEIADLRGAARGTVRSQLSQVYAKAEISGQSMLAASFIEDLLDDPVVTLREGTRVP